MAGGFRLAAEAKAPAITGERSHGHSTRNLRTHARHAQLHAALQVQIDTEPHADEDVLAAQRIRFSEELAAEPERMDATFPLPPPSHSTLPPVATTSPERLQHARSEPLGSLRDAREQETEARRRLYRLKRELTLAKLSRTKRRPPC